MTGRASVCAAWSRGRRVASHDFAERSRAHGEPRSACSPHPSRPSPADRSKATERRKTIKHFSWMQACVEILRARHSMVRSSGDVRGAGWTSGLRGGRQEAFVERASRRDVGKDGPIRQPLDRRSVVGERVRRWCRDVRLRDHERCRGPGRSSGSAVETLTEVDVVGIGVGQPDHQLIEVQRRPHPHLRELGGHRAGDRLDQLVVAGNALDVEGDATTAR